MTRARAVVAAQGPAERSRARLAALSALSPELVRLRDLDELCRSMYREITHVIEAQTFFLGLYDEASESLQVVRQFDSGVELPGGLLPLGDGLTSQVIRTRQPRLIRQWSVEGPRVVVQYATGTPGLPESTVTVPLLVSDRVIGVLSVGSYRPNAFDEDDLLMMQGVAGLGAAMIENLRQAGHLDAQLWRRVSELEAILTSMAEGLLIMDGDGRVIRLNHAARHLLSFEDKSIVVGQPLSPEQVDRWPGGDQAVAEALNTLRKALQMGQAAQELEVEVGDRTRVLSFSGTPLRDGTGILTGGVIVFRDVTARRDLEHLKDEMLHQVEQKSRLLEDASRHKSEFLANMSHELRTPLNAIIGFSEVLTERIFGELNEKQAEYLDDILGSGRHLLSLINDILDLSKVEAGQMQLEIGTFSLAEVLDNGLTVVRERASRHGLRLSLDVDPAIGLVQADERKIKQVIFNLLSNAVKFTPDGGRVDVVARLVEGDVQVAVRDTGIGIAPQDQEQIFEEFQQLPAGKSSIGEGTGLGLALARKFVELHGGRLWLESELGVGSTFAFTLRPAHLR